MLSTWPSGSGRKTTWITGIIRADRTASGRAVDASICPTTITAAVLPGQFVHPDWTFFVNVLDATAVTMPVGFADKGVDVLDPTLEPLNEQDAKIAAQCT